MFVLVAVIFIVLPILFIVYPFFSPRDKGIRVLRNMGEPSVRAKLREKKAQLLMVFRELDFDFETGKLSKEDYVALREKYEQKTALVMKQLEEVETSWKKWEAEEF